LKEVKRETSKDNMKKFQGGFIMFDLMTLGNRGNSLFNYLDNVERNFFGNYPQGVSYFRTDITDEGDKLILKADLPGFDKKDIKVEVKDDCMTISAQRNEENEDKKDKYVYRERRYGSFARSFDVSNIKSDEITAEYKNGILTLNLPKREEAIPQSHKIEVN
jgi:HSP20 family protein